MGTLKCGDRQGAGVDERSDACGAGRGDGPVRASSERVAAALCTVTGVGGGRVDETTRRLVEALVREYHGRVGGAEGVDYDPVADEFLTHGGELRVEVDRFPVDPARWEALLAAVGAVAVVAYLAAVGGLAPAGARALPVCGLAFVFAGLVVRTAARADVAVDGGDGGDAIER